MIAQEVFEMEIQDAIKVIRALADGVHPETREALKDDSI